MEFLVHCGQQKISRPGEGYCFSVFSRDTFKRSIDDQKTLKRSKSTGNKSENQERWRPNLGEFCLWLSKTFLEILFALSDPHRLRLNSEKNKNPAFNVLLGLKDWDEFHKGRR